MNIDREKFLSALLAMSLGGAAAACSKPPAEPAPVAETTVGAEAPVAEAAPPPAPEEPAPAAVPEVVQTGPTTE